MQEQEKDYTARALPGATEFEGGIMTFAIYAPGKRSVQLQGSFNDWTGSRDPLRDRGGGFFVLQKHLSRGTYEYQFVIDEQITVCDPYAQAIRPDPSGTPRAVIRVEQPIYQWQHAAWPRPRFEDLIIYELHVGDFSPEGTFRGVIDRLDYLRDLGINAIEFMPLYESASYWGYEPTYFFAPRASYGTVGDLRQLIDEAHGRGIATILDLVLAQTSAQHPFAKMYPYEQSPWYGPGLGETNRFGLPQLDYSKDATNSFVRDVQSFWMRDFQIDGFRYDYLIGIGQDLQGRGVPSLIKVATQIHPEEYLIGECIPENPELINRSGINGAWHTRSQLLLATLLQEKDHVPYRANEFEKNIRELEPATQDYAAVSSMVNYYESHDDMRMLDGLKQAGFDEETAYQKAALGLIVLLTMPGEVMLFQGQEWGEDTAKTLEANKLQWGRSETPQGHKMRELCRTLCSLRRSRVCLRRHDLKVLQVWGDQKSAVYYRRYGEMHQTLVATNFSGQSQTIAMPVPQPGRWQDPFTHEIFDLPASFKIELVPYSARIFCLGVL